MPLPVRAGLAGSLSGSGAAESAAATGVLGLALLPPTLVFEALLTEHLAFWGFMPDEDTESPLAETATGAAVAVARGVGGGGGGGGGHGSSPRCNGGSSSSATVGGDASSATAMSAEFPTGTEAWLNRSTVGIVICDIYLEVRGGRMTHWWVGGLGWPPAAETAKPPSRPG